MDKTLNLCYNKGTYLLHRIEEIVVSNLDETRQDISNLLRDLFDVIRRRAEVKIHFDRRHEIIAQYYEEQDTPLAERESAIKQELLQLVLGNKTQLLTGGIKSFAMLYGSVSFRLKPKTAKISDKGGVESLARRDRILTKVGSFKRIWTPDIDKLIAWLAENPDRAAAYEPLLIREGGYNQVFAKPNTRYLTDFDPDRLTDPSINLGREPDSAPEDDA